jgi:hypothetical protein
VTTVDLGAVSVAEALLDLAEGMATLDEGAGTFPLPGTALLPVLFVAELLEGAAFGVVAFGDVVRGATGTALGLLRALALVPNDGASFRGVGFCV